jgi:hypothetical protein
MNSYVAYVSRRVLNSGYTKFGLNRLRGQRVNCFSLIELVVLIVELFNLVEIAYGVKEKGFLCSLCFPPGSE